VGKDASQVRRDVEEARTQLGETVEALAYKANAPRRLARRGRAAVVDLRARVSRTVRDGRVRLTRSGPPA
jgi:hypothetical protein